MRTTDFSRLPRIGQARAQFVGATKFRSPIDLVGLAFRWFPMERRLRRAEGYMGHMTFFWFPFTFGTIAFFADRDSLLRFARSPEHADLIQWVMRPNARGGFIRLWAAEPAGYSSGVWRAEPPSAMRAISHFSALVDEERPPLVEDAARHRR